MTSRGACSHRHVFWLTIVRLILYVLICVQQTIEEGDGRSRQLSGGVVVYDSEKSSETKQILSSKDANHKNKKKKEKKNGPR